VCASQLTMVSSRKARLLQLTTATSFPYMAFILSATTVPLAFFWIRQITTWWDKTSSLRKATRKTLCSSAPSRYVDAAVQTDPSELKPRADPSICEDESFQNDGLVATEGDLLVRDTPPSTKKFIRFASEDEGDYTSGPIRIVNAHDGVRPDAAALLMNLDFSCKIQAAIQAQRDVEAAEQAVFHEKNQLTDLILDIQGELTNCEFELAISESQISEDAHALAKRRAILQDFLDCVERRCDFISARVTAQAANLRVRLADINEYLHDAFIAADLISPPAEEPVDPLELLDFKTEFQLFCEEHDDGEAVELHGPSVGQNPEQKAQSDATGAFYQAQHEWDHAQVAFDNREEDRDKEELTTEERPEEFHIRWVQKNRDLTRALINAESAYLAAKATAIKEGVQAVIHLQSAQFKDHPNDGYLESREQQGMPTGPCARVTGWMDQIPDNASPDVECADISDAQHTDIEEADMWDSCSQCRYDDDPRNRSMIDAWQKNPNPAEYRKTLSYY
jgi:hypothetical protein